MTEQTSTENQNIIALLGIEALPDEKKVALLDQMADLVLKRVMLDVMTQLDGADAKKAEDLSDDSDKLMAFLSERFDMPRLLSEETEKVKAELVENAEHHPAV